jgi:putative CocE/NonD family hydrolase
MKSRWIIITLVLTLSWCDTPRGQSAFAQEAEKPSIRQRYIKYEYKIPMRDGVRLFTNVYVPRDKSKTYPILMMRTPYSVGPYGADNYPAFGLGPNRQFSDDGYIFAYQDVRGCFMSEGTFVNMTPHLDRKVSNKDIDESTDTYDTVDWLIKNVPNYSGKVGQWGISYPGFYSSAGMIDHHPALVAVSPQAPIADWFFDDFHHHGAFFLPHAFNFLASFGRPRPKPTTQWSGGIRHGTPDGYQFFMGLGSLRNADPRYFKGQVAFWNTIAEHPNYDGFWQARNLLPHLKNTAPAVMTVGGWYDAEDLYGALKTYRAIEKQNPGIFNVIVMGPWFHGGWSRGDGDRLGNVYFDSKTSEFYRKNMELPFFRRYLKDDTDAPQLPEAYMFETGANHWRTFAHWPPEGLEKRALHFRAGAGLSFDAAPDQGLVYDEYASDPNKPVPFTEAVNIGMTREYMTDDQRFAARRPDVLAYQTEPLREDITLAGPLQAELWVSTSGTDSDWVVKLIDVFPDDARDGQEMSHGEHMAGYQMMVRSEVIRGRFRESYAQPKPFVADQPTKVPLELQDVLHTFQKGHRIMVQVQSTWFPLVDRNPQKYVDNIFEAADADFVKATQRVYRAREYPSAVHVGVLPQETKSSP